MGHPGAGAELPQAAPVLTQCSSGAAGIISLCHRTMGRISSSLTRGVVSPPSTHCRKLWRQANACLA